jgi:hypothetical protein
MDKYKYFSLLLVASVFVTSFFITPEQASADVISEEECFPAVLMLKGSGEGKGAQKTDYYSKNSSSNVPFITTNGHEGPVLGRMLKAFVDDTKPAETVSKVRFIGIKTPSLPVEPTIPKLNDDADPAAKGLLISSIWINHTIQYDESYRAGAQKTLDFIKEDESRGCQTQYMLMSYSQGVISARLVMNLLNNETDKIISSYVVGDPFQKPDGATSSNQKTASNTSPNTPGVARIAASVIKQKVIEGDPIDGPLRKLLGTVGITIINNFTEEMTDADPFIYRDEGLNGIVSRSLCHRNDPTCGIEIYADIDIEQHINYFDSTKDPGIIDLAHEVAEFDKQVKKLAESTNENPRERTLTNTLPIMGKTTTYNIASARPDDRCLWDEGSDGTIDFDSLCDTYNVIHTSKPKMTVTVIDSFREDYTFSSESEAIDPTILESALSLDPNSWYAFHSYARGELKGEGVGTPRQQCVKVHHSFALPVAPVNYNMFSSYCSMYWDPGTPLPEDASHMFKSSPYGAENRLLWGYDDDYTWTDGGAEEWPDGDGFMRASIENLSYNKNQNIKPILSTFINGKPYYFIQHENKCYNGWRFVLCNTADPEQLFEVTKDTRQFGSFSIEKDVTPPTPVTGLHLLADQYSSSVTLKWEPSTDVRTYTMDYEIYQKDDITNISTFINKISDKTSYKLDTSNMTIGKSYTFEVVAVDYAGHKSITDVITFKLPSFEVFQLPALNYNPPAPPFLVEASSNPSAIKLGFSNHGNPVTKVRLYKYDVFVAVVTGAEYTDFDVESGKGYRYTYEAEIAPNVYADRSASFDGYAP